VTASNSTLAMPTEVMRIGVWPAFDFGRRTRHWLPSLLVSLCANLLLLYLFPVLLQPRTAAPETASIRVTLSPAAPAKVAPAPPLPPKPQPPRVKPRPRPVTPPPPPKPVPQPRPVANPEPQPTPPPAPIIPAPAPPTPEPVAAPEPPPLPKAQPLFKLTRLPAFAEKRVPPYPESERANGREAEVLAEVFIDGSGRVLEVTIIKSAGRAFDEAVITALRGSRFTPGYMDAKAVAVRFQIPFHFQLN
jgi:protein TonB